MEHPVSVQPVSSFVTSVTDLKKITSVTRRTHFQLSWNIFTWVMYQQWWQSKKVTEHFYLDQMVTPLEPLVAHIQRKCSVALAFPTSPSCSVPRQSSSASNLFSIHKTNLFVLAQPFRKKPNQALLPVSICCRNSCAVTLSWGCRMGLYSCLALDLFCFKQEHLLIRVKHSLILCTKSEDILWTKATKSRSSCMHRPHSWPILVPAAAQSQRKREEMEREVSSWLVHVLHQLAASVFVVSYRC